MDLKYILDIVLFCLNTAILIIKVEEKLSNTLMLPSQHSLPIDQKLEPE